MANSVKTLLIIDFILIVGQMTTCNVKGVTGGDKPTENHHHTAVFLSSMKFFSVFQLIVLVLCPANSLFWFTLTSLNKPQQAAVFSK